jgi:hypothetical protein
LANELGPLDPAKLVSLIWVRRHWTVQKDPQDWSHFVFRHAVIHHGAIANAVYNHIGPRETTAEFGTHTTGDRVSQGLAWGRVTTTGIGPDSGPCLLRQRPAGDQQAPVWIKGVRGERQVQRGVRMVGSKLRRHADSTATLIEKDDQFSTGEFAHMPPLISKDAHDSNSCTPAEPTLSRITVDE